MFNKKLMIFLFIQAGLTGSTQSSVDAGIDNQVIIEWNQMAYKIAWEHDEFYSLTGIRALTMSHLAIHDALNSINPRFERYAYFQDHPKADPVCAVSQSAFEVLVNIYPARKDTLLLLLKKWLTNSTELSSKQEGIHLGKQISHSILEKRSNDGHQKQGDYTPMSKPGDYQYTPGWKNWVLKPDFNYATPFALDSVTQFRSPPPPSLQSKKYADSFIEVKNYGAKNSWYRTADQTNYAHWWAEFAEHSWNRIGRITAKKLKLPAWETARMFALINMDIYDIYLASLESKYYYDTWRPYTAIRNADRDNNPDTSPDHTWEPEMLTPPWPEYPSAHAAAGAGGAEIVSHVIGADNISFTMESTSGLEKAKKRPFHNLKEAAYECAESRIMNGYHFRFATEEGLRQGSEIARFIHSNLLRPVSLESNSK